MEDFGVMHLYMVEIGLPHYFSQEFMALIPEQRALVNELQSDGVIHSYSLSLDRSKLWVVMVAESPEEVDDILESFPIMPYCDSETNELMFHNSISRELPVISMN